MTRTGRRFARASSATLLAAAAAYFVAFKAGWIPSSAGRFSVIAAVALVPVAAVLGFALEAAFRGPRRTAAAGEALVAAGLLLVGSGGLANWALGYHGFVVVPERAPVRLSNVEELNALDAGPLGRLGELDLTIGLARLAFTPEGPGRFSATSRLKVLDSTGRETAVEVASGRSTRIGNLVLQQGAFGFAPRVVVARGGETLMDAFVPFRTIREGRNGIAFVGEFELARADLSFRGAVTLDDLTEDMKGHPALELEIVRGGVPPKVVGLRPGQAADLDGGVSVSYTGLRRWSEIDFARGTHRAPVFAGLALFAAGLVVSLVALRWRT